MTSAKLAKIATRSVGGRRSVFGIPLILGCISLAGLLIALLGDEHWRYAAWPAVASPLLVAGYFVARARRFFAGPRR